MRGRDVLPLLLALLCLAPVGWRLDGRSVQDDLAGPETWSADRAVWSLKLGGWSNATPVVSAGKVFTTVEPTTLVAVELASGRLLWRTDNDVIGTMSGEPRREAEGRLAALPGLEAALADALKSVGELRRASRSAEAPPDTATRLTAMIAVADALKKQIDHTAPLRTPSDKGIIGYATPTPVVDGANVYALFGNGVVSSYTTDGKRRWSVWLGAPSDRMRGYDYGSVSSPVLVDGVLVVAHGKLRGLDPATGAVRWEGPAWPHYGTPAVLTVGGVGYLLTPDGEARRARDGAKVAQGLADLWYLGPVAVGDTAWWIGGYAHESQGGGTRAVGWRFASDGAGGLKTTQLFQTPVPGTERIYASPLVHDGQIWTIDRRLRVTSLDAATGAVIYQSDLSKLSAGIAYANPVRLRDRIVVTLDDGQSIFLKPGRAFEVLGKASVPGTTRATPVFTSSGVLVRYGPTLSLMR